MNKLVTVYITTHNRKSLVSKAIDSVLSQTYEPIELIIVDDGSTDGTFEYITKKYIEKNIIILQNKVAMGACYARNTAISQSTGYFITGLDDDDYFTKNRVSMLVGGYSNKYKFVCDSSQSRNNCMRIIRLNDILQKNIIGNQVLTKKSILVKIGGFDENMPAWQDYDLWFRLLREDNSVALQLPNKSMKVISDHGMERITKNKESVKLAFDKFMQKNNTYYSRCSFLERKVRAAYTYNLGLKNIFYILSRVFCFRLKVIVKLFIVIIGNAKVKL